MHQLVRLLRVCAGECDPAGDAGGGGGAEGGAAPGEGGVPQYFARGGGTSEICLQRVSGAMREGAGGGGPEHLAGGGAVGDGGLHSAGEGGGGGAGGLPGDLPSRDLRGVAHFWPEEG